MDTESYLRRFHRAVPGATAAGLGRGRTHDGRDSYQLVVDACAGAPVRVLELGCGDGVLAARLTDIGHEVRGVDLSPEDVARARSRGVAALVARAQRLPFAAGGFDVVASHLALMLMPLEDTLRECRRVLRPGGRLLALVQSDVPPTGAFLTFAQRMHAALDGVDVPELGDARTSDRDAMDAALSEAGFEGARYEDAILRFAPADRRALFATLYGVDLLPEAAREGVLAAADEPGECTCRVRLVQASASG